MGETNKAREILAACEAKHRAELEHAINTAISMALQKGQALSDYEAAVLKAARDYRARANEFRQTPAGPNYLYRQGIVDTALDKLASVSERPDDFTSGQYLESANDQGAS